MENCKKNKGVTVTVTESGGVTRVVEDNGKGMVTAKVSGFGVEEALEAASVGEAYELTLEEADRLLRINGYRRRRKRKGIGI